MITDNQTNKIYFSPALEKGFPVLWDSIHSALMKRGIRHGVLMNDPQNAQGSGTMCIYFAIYLVISIIILTFAAVNNKFTIMARQLRKESATGIHHVMLRGINRQDIFVDSEDYRVFVYYLHKLVRPKNDLGQPIPAYASFYAYCLMNNHVHLLIKEGGITWG